MRSNLWRQEEIRECVEGMQDIDVFEFSIATRKQFEIVGIAATACREESLNNLIVYLVVTGQLPVEIIRVVPEEMLLFFLSIFTKER